MKADWFDYDGQHVEFGQYTPLTKSIYRAAKDAAEMFGGRISMVNSGAKWALVKVGKKRLVIGE